MDNIFLKGNFADHIKSKEWEIIEQAKNKILNDKNFPIFKDFYLKNFWLNRASKKDVFILCISNSDMLSIELDKVENALKNEITRTLKTHSYITVGKDLQIISTNVLKIDETQKVREMLVEISKKEICIFFFGERGINTFINGHETGDNIFLTTEDLLSFSEKYEIEDIKKAFDKYKNQYLTRDHVYSRFFESKSVIISIFGNPTSSEFKSNKNLLKNSPEKLFRDNLIDFLNENVKATFNSEMELLSSRKPIDIHTEKKGKLYFFEVKWLGTSKHATKNEVGENQYVGENANRRANEGVLQTLDYIEEVIEKMNRDLHCGYLIIFDARNVHNQIVYNGSDTIPQKHLKYHRDKFDIIDDLIVDNIQPLY